MKKQIRRGVFETNSSSTHAICITKESVIEKDFPNHVTFTHGEFGWETVEYSDLWSKASYLYEAICCCYEEEQKEEVINNITETLNGYGITCDFEPDREGKWSYIDHGSQTIDFVEGVLEDEDKLLRYLFGNSFIVTGNDNDDGYSDRMYINEGEKVTEWGIYTKYGGLKSEFDNYEIYRKGN